MTLFLTWLYRTPYAFVWTIPGTVLVGDALTHLAFAEVIGTYVATAVLVFLLGWTGLIGRFMAVLPPTIMQAMVAGIFLHFGLGLIEVAIDDPPIVLPMILVFVLLSINHPVVQRVAHFAPAVAAAAIFGTALAFMLGRVSEDILDNGIFAHPELIISQFSWAAMVELVLPLAITVVVVQNG